MKNILLLLVLEINKLLKFGAVIFGFSKANFFRIAELLSKILTQPNPKRTSRMRSLLFANTLFLVLSSFAISAQVNYTANDQVKSYDGFFRPGSNLGLYQGWDEVKLANIAAGNPALGIDGAGVRAIRPALRGDYLDFYGYDAQVNTFEHYYNLDLKDLTCIVGYPPQWARDTLEHCSGYQSEMFINLYHDIWDNGENGTPINDNNHYAAYIYRVVTHYKKYVKFWEIWNEPGFDFTGAKGWLPPGPNFPGNWWDNNPDPCDNILRAPIYNYVRMLRISYQVIKTVDPDAYVSVAGVGFPSFLDAALRNTDNPVDGSVTDEYPLKGGAYFDVMGFHSYPHFDGSLRYWSNEIQGFIHTRHSDAAADGILRRQGEYQTVLENYGYDGITFPKKEWIITEINVPRKSFPFVFGHYIGSEEAQINFLIKAVVTAMQNSIHTMHVYNLGEEEDIDVADYEFKLMGLYKRLRGTAVEQVELNQEGIAYKTASDLLFETRADATKTAAMKLPTGVRGGAFVNDAGEYTYVLWAKTSIDSSEVANAIYSLPVDFDIREFELKQWEYSRTNATKIINSQFIELDATPIFLTKATEQNNRPPTAGFVADEAKGCIPFEVSFTNVSAKNATDLLWSFEGANIINSSEENPTVTYNQAGTYLVSLKASNIYGTDSIAQNNYITVGDLPVSSFSFEKENDSTVVFTNNSIASESVLWGFGNGEITNEENPSYTYSEDGIYDLVLIASNFCGDHNSFQQIEIITIPEGNFEANVLSGCVPLEINFSDLSTTNATSWNWSFPGSLNENSTEQNPTVTYDSPGFYDVELIVGNEAGNDTIQFPTYIMAESTPIAGFEPNIFGRMISFETNIVGADSVHWDFGDGHTSTDLFPTYSYATDGVFNVSLQASNHCGTVEVIKQVTIITPPTSGFIANVVSGCSPLTVEFIDQSSMNVEEWIWIFPGGNPDSSKLQNPIVVYEAAGNYSVVLQVTNDAGKNTTIETSYISVAPGPIASFLPKQDGFTINTMNTSEYAESYFWDFGDSNTSTEIAPIHTYADAGEYLIMLIAESTDCGRDTVIEKITVLGPNSIELLDFLNDFRLFPNPNHGQFTLLLNGEGKEELNFTMFNILGQVIHQEELDFSTGHLQKEFDFAKLSKGTYLVQLSSGDGIVYKKVVVE